jgi:hypothetical protein
MSDFNQSRRSASLRIKFWTNACLALFLISCAWADNNPSQKNIAPDDPKNPAFAPVQEDPLLPRVLLIGDSISVGYTVPVRKMLQGKANVLRIPVNGGPTTRGLELLDAWIAGQKWDVIHFNWGLHDVKHMKNGKLDISGAWQVDPETYRNNLDALVRKLQHTGARLIWASTTPIPEGAGGRVKGDEVRANAIADEVMKKYTLKTDDLYSGVLPHLGQYQHPRNVHFTAEGYEFLAKQVTSSILDALESMQRKEPNVLHPAVTKNSSTSMDKK